MSITETRRCCWYWKTWPVATDMGSYTSSADNQSGIPNTGDQTYNNQLGDTGLPRHVAWGLRTRTIPESCHVHRWDPIMSKPLQKNERKKKVTCVHCVRFSVPRHPFICEKNWRLPKTHVTRATKPHGVAGVGRAPEVAGASHTGPHVARLYLLWLSRSQRLLKLWRQH